MDSEKADRIKFQSSGKLECVDKDPSTTPGI